MTNELDWTGQTNIYEVNLRQYSTEGTIKAFMGHLPRLKDMGVHTLWFMPLTPVSQKEKKGSLGSYYACSDYVSVSSEFGTLEDFRELVRQAHQLGMKVILDWVANHTGWDHHWTVEHPDWYERDPATGNFKRASGMDDIIELDFTNRDMRRAMTDAMKFWVREAGIDGFRCDLAFWVELDYWQEAIPEVNAVKPLFWLAESDPLENTAYMEVFNAAYTWTWMHQSEKFYKNQVSFRDLTVVLDRYQSAPGMKAWFTSNHDENSWNGTEYEKYGDAAPLLAVHSCTWPGLPLIYSGQELPNLKRLKFFDKDPIEWTGKYECHGFYKTLLGLQRSHPALHAKAEIYRLYTSSDEQMLAYLRKSKEHEVIVLLNFSAYAVRFDIRSTWISGNFIEVFTGQHNDFAQHREFKMEAWSYRVFVKEL